jgi:AcrR family transcriptional regulator
MRLKPDQRKTRILKAAVVLAAQIGHLNITIAELARRTHISRALIYKHFENLHHLQRDIYRYAVLNQEFDILKHCVSDRRVNMTDTTKHKILKYMAST